MRKEAFGHFQKVLILTSNRVMDAVVGQNNHVLKMFQDPFSHDAGKFMYHLSSVNCTLVCIPYHRPQIKADFKVVYP